MTYKKKESARESTIFIDRAKNSVFFSSSEDPPSKENPYEDIELERSCLGSKCISSVSSSPVPDTPTKVPSHYLTTTETTSIKNRIICNFV